MEKKQKDLLEIIALEAGCDYVSDMHLSVNKTAVGNVVKSIKEEAYSLEEWDNVVSYILGSGAKAVSPMQAKTMILDQLGTGEN